MCGRFTITVGTAELQQAFPWAAIPPGLEPRYNIAPTQPVAVIPNDGRSQLDFFVWGLIPSWAKDPAMGSRMINARAETLAEKPAFRAAYRRRRCLVIADGFYEWQQIPGQKNKQPMYITLEDRQPFAFAGLWENWNSPDGSQILSCTIINTSPNQLLARIHNRMPVILPPNAYQDWLDPEEGQPERWNHLLEPYRPEEMVAFPVSTMVNSPGNDSPACVAPLAE
jgi:putative SOS response-associated peptidase YedK